MDSNSHNHIQPDDALLPATLQPAKGDFTWITNDAILRDEGALYGIASADISDKMQAIVSYFQTLMAAPLQKKQFTDQRAQELELVISVTETEAENICNMLETTPRQKNSKVPALLQLLAVTAVCVFNFFLIQWWLSPVIKSEIICVGIYLAGLFSVYLGRGLKYSLAGNTPVNEEVNPSSLKTFFIEFAVAAAIAVFICTLTYESYPVKNTVAASVIFFLLFLAGKVLLNTFANFRQEAGSYMVFAITRKRLRKQQKAMLEKKETAIASLSALRLQVQEAETLLKKLQAEQEYKSRLFLSEYHLAVETRQSASKLPSKQFA